MYKKTFKDAGAFLRENWLFAIIVTVISFAADYSLSLLSIMGVITLSPDQNFLGDLILTFALFPMSLGVIKCFDVAKYEGKKNPLYLFYFYADFKRFFKALLIGLITVLLSNQVISKFTFIPHWIVELLGIFSFVIFLYFFLSSYIMVKTPELSLGKIIKCSFQKIKGNINTLFFLILTILIPIIILTPIIENRQITLQMDAKTNMVSLIITLITTYFANVIFFCFADIILTEQPQDSRFVDTVQTRLYSNSVDEYDETNYNKNTDYDESVDIEGYDSSQFNDNTLFNYRLFINYEPIEAKEIEYDIETENLDAFRVEELYDNEQIYFFLKDDSQVQKLFEQVFTTAKDEYQSYIEEGNTGIGYDEDKINSNKMNLEMKVSKDIVCNSYIIHVNFKINAD